MWGNLYQQRMHSHESLVHAAMLYREMTECEKFGLSAEKVGFDLQKIYEYKDLSAARMREELEKEFKELGGSQRKGNRNDPERQKGQGSYAE